MSEPSLALTFQDYILRVAEHLAITNYDETVAGIPTDAHDLDLCKRIVNDAYRRFYNSAPRWNWSFPMFNITFDSAGTSDRVVDATNWRYYMPDGFYGHLIGNLSYVANSGVAEIVPAPPHSIMEKYAIASTSGHPLEYAIRPLSGDDKRRWELIVWPAPSADDVIISRCSVYPNKMIELADKANCGLAMEEAYLACCLAEAETKREDSSGLMESQWAEALIRALAIDQKTAPARLGDYGGRTTTGDNGRRSVTVDTYNGVAV